jgi:hypothetical protein
MTKNKETTPEITKGAPTLGYNSDGIMGSTTTEDETFKEVKANIETIAINKVAVFSTRNLYADGFGKLNVGYNIVLNKYSDFWLSQSGVRLATLEEVAEAFA